MLLKLQTHPIPEEDSEIDESDENDESDQSDVDFSDDEKQVPIELSSDATSSIFVNQSIPLISPSNVPLSSPHKIKPSSILSTNKDSNTNTILAGHLIAKRLIEEHIAIEEELLKQQTSVHQDLFY